MALIGISLLVASVVIFCLRPPAWLPGFLANLRLRGISGPTPKPAVAAPEPEPEEEEGTKGGEDEATRQPVPTIQEPEAHQDADEEGAIPTQQAPIIQEPQEEDAIEPSWQDTHEEDSRTQHVQMKDVRQEDTTHEEEQTTPKASATPRGDVVPSLVLPASLPTAPSPPLQRSIPSFTTTPPAPPNLNTVSEPPESVAKLMPPPPPPAPRTTDSASTSTAATAASALMPPPPVPKVNTKIPRPSGIPLPKSSPTSGSGSASASASSPGPSTSSPRRIPTLNGTASPTPARNLPIPRRGFGSGTAPRSSSGGPARAGAGGLGGGLAPPPTATGIPKKPSRQVTLEPGHSPLDWARLAQSPTSDLRGLPADTPYLRVTPSMLRQQNGRRGRDAWSVYGGKVYNVSPYLPFHPGGKPELLRGAGRDATRLFAEVHPWVNYETMLQSCLVGLFVEEHEATNQMEEMD